MKDNIKGLYIGLLPANYKTKSPDTQTNFFRYAYAFYMLYEFEDYVMDKGLIKYFKDIRGIK